MGNSPPPPFPIQKRDQASPYFLIQPEVDFWALEFWAPNPEIIPPLFGNVIILSQSLF
jgi:hypothetical protein